MFNDSLSTEVLGHSLPQHADYLDLGESQVFCSFTIIESPSSSKVYTSVQLSSFISISIALSLCLSFRRNVLRVRTFSCAGNFRSPLALRKAKIFSGGGIEISTQCSSWTLEVKIKLAFSIYNVNQAASIPSNQTSCITIKQTGKSS